ncbi:hypothetical protein ACIGDK_16725, partial [Pseudomonas sp. NPDC079069]
VVPAYTIKDTDAGKVLEVSVRAKNKAAVIGNILTKKTSDTTGNTVTDGGTGGVVIDTKVAPAISDLKINGKLNVGEKLSASYVFDAKTGERTDVSTYLWGQAGTATGVTSSTTAVSTTGVVPAYTIKDTDAGKVLEVSVRAKNKAAVIGNTLTATTANSTGTVTDGGTGGVVIDTNAAPAISGLAISGKLNVGETLSASYVFDSMTGVEGDASTYVWGQTGTATGVINSTDVVTQSGKVPEYTIKKTDAGKVLEVSVRAKNKAGVTGNIATATVKVKGLVPLATNVYITSSNTNGTPFSGGQTLTGNYTYSHPDNVDEGTSTFIWQRDGTSIVGETQKTYTLVEADDVGHKITFGVTPVSSTSTYNTGLTVMSNTEQINSVLAPLFFLDKKTRTWAQADTDCKNAGAKLPTSVELQALFVRATRATVANGSQYNNDMCHIHKWPLNGPCGGSTSSYWSSTRSGGVYINVSLINGDAANSSADFNTLQVACKR